MYKYYGLTGKTVKMKLKKRDVAEYPWLGQAVPVLITSEYPSFLMGTVLPHISPHGFSTNGRMPLSKPYPITIEKFDLKSGEIIIVGGVNV